MCQAAEPEGAIAETGEEFRMHVWLIRFRVCLNIEAGLNPRDLTSQRGSTRRDFYHRVWSRCCGLCGPEYGDFGGVDEAADWNTISGSGVSTSHNRPPDQSRHLASLCYLLQLCRR